MIPGNVLSVTPIVGPFLPPRNTTRYSATAGKSDVHYGGIAIGDPSRGVSYQVWTCYTDGIDIWLTAPNTPPFRILLNVNPAWVALAFDQNARPFIAYASKNGVANYYWFDSTIHDFRTSVLPGTVYRVFAALDDSRPALLSQSDVLLAYVRGGELYLRAQRDRYGVEYDLDPAPAILVQIGMNAVDRFQFSFQNVQGDRVVPPAEFSPALGFNEPA